MGKRGVQAKRTHIWVVASYDEPRQRAMQVIRVSEDSAKKYMKGQEVKGYIITFFGHYKLQEVLHER